MLKFYKKFYVGLRNSDKTPLAFLTHITDDDSFSKRKATVDSWAGGSKGFEIENERISGFKIIDYVTRHRTDNKVFRIVDPRGLQFEIYTENLLEIIKVNF